MPVFNALVTQQFKYEATYSGSANVSVIADFWEEAQEKIKAMITADAIEWEMVEDEIFAYEPEGQPSFHQENTYVDT